ncbi:hypothetical protein K1T71_006497 [Dendrolimus kikuchii]|uniref:Uncharacterized protein n=1 Tax=Dendrolimus kikuchii TaxID=765133 RepID=A0ACC1D1L6_9NEOP|nr:hypothetical protein K1T71_006497 [Dendrolimus kikuchii]
MPDLSAKGKIDPEQPSYLESDSDELELLPRIEDEPLLPQSTLLMLLLALLFWSLTYLIVIFLSMSFEKGVRTIPSLNCFFYQCNRSMYFDFNETVKYALA